MRTEEEHAALQALAAHNSARLFAIAAEPTRHTPGPWRIATGQGRFERTLIVGPSWPNGSRAALADLLRVANDYDMPTELANARLMAAAPELLDACKALLYHIMTREVGLDESRRFAKAKDAASAAIAKAEGRS